MQKVSGSTTTVYVFSGSKVIAEYDNGAAVGSPSHEYIYGGGALLAKIDSSGTKYYHQDHLSNRLVTDSSGNTYAQMGHFPFGETWYNTANDKFQFTTYERDAESGNDYAMARMYVNRLSRFSSLDPLAGSAGDPQSLNRYDYVENDPSDLDDPSGGCPTWGPYTTQIPGKPGFFRIVCTETGTGHKVTFLAVLNPLMWFLDPAYDDGGHYTYDPTKCWLGGNCSIVGVISDNADNSGNTSGPANSVTSKRAHCAWEAAKDRGISIALDVVGAIPGVGNATSATAGVIRATIRVDQLITKPAVGLASGAYGVYGAVSAGPGNPTDSLVGAGSAGAGIGLALADASLGGTKAIPIAGNAVSVLTLGWDAYQAYKTYRACMAGPD